MGYHDARYISRESREANADLVQEVLDDMICRQSDLRVILSDETVDAWLDKLTKAVE